MWGVVVVVLSLCLVLSGCAKGTEAPSPMLRASSPLVSPLPQPSSTPRVAAPVSSPPAPPPGVPEKVATFAGAAKYLAPRMPTQQVVDRWNELAPPRALRGACQEFADSAAAVVEAHEAFNDAAFKRSTTPVSEAQDDLELALKNHAQARETLEAKLDQFMQDEYGISWDEMPEIAVSLEP